jgi:hypothetical protein
MEIRRRQISYDEKTEHLINDIYKQIDEMKVVMIEPEFILVNMRNYERLMSYCFKRYGTGGLPDEFMGLKIVVWDVPLDYCNVRGKASLEFTQFGMLRKRRGN